MITRGNYEEYIMMHVDGELQPAQEKALQDFLDLHPELKNDLLTYELTKLSPDESLTFAGKNALLKPSPIKNITSFPLWVKYGIAAGIAMICFISLFKFSATNRNKDVAGSDKLIIEQGGKKKAPPDADIIQPPATSATAKNDTGITTVTHTTIRNAVAKSIIKTNRKNVVPGQIIIPISTATINKIAVAEIKQLPCNKRETLYTSVTEIPVYPSIANNSEEKKTFWDKLPIDDLKKKELENISNEINAAKNSLDEKTLTIKIEKRKLILSF